MNLNDLNNLRQDNSALFSHRFRGFEIQEGWVNLIVVFVKRLQSMVDASNESAVFGDPVWEPKIVQIKEKFGGLRIYMDGGTPEIASMIKTLEPLSFLTCETCGAPGHPDNHDGYYTTRCDKHHKELDDERRTR